MNNQKQAEITLKLDVMIGQLQQAINAINRGNNIAAGVYMEMVQNQLPKTRMKLVRG